MWIEDLLKRYNRKRVEITFNEHILKTQNKRNLDLDLVEETIRTGNIIIKKCERPNKLCSRRYFGKINESYDVILRVRDNLFEAITAWKRKGR